MGRPELAEVRISRACIHPLAGIRPASLLLVRVRSSPHRIVGSAQGVGMSCTSRSVPDRSTLRLGPHVAAWPKPPFRQIEQLMTLSAKLRDPSLLSPSEFLQIVAHHQFERLEEDVFARLPLAKPVSK